jgi:hypothetical protein
MKESCTNGRYPVSYVLNDTINSETGTSAFSLRFGSDVETYRKLPSQLPPTEFTSKYVKLLDENLYLLRDILKAYQDELVRERTRENDEERQTVTEKGTWFYMSHLGKTIP